MVVTIDAYILFYRRKDFDWTSKLDYNAIRQTCNLEQFIEEVKQYSAEEQKSEDIIEALEDKHLVSERVNIQKEESDYPASEKIAQNLQNDQMKHTITFNSLQ